MCHVLPECYLISFSTTCQVHYSYQTADNTDAQRSVMARPRSQPGCSAVWLSGASSSPPYGCRAGRPALFPSLPMWPQKGDGAIFPPGLCSSKWFPQLLGLASVWW